MAWHEAYGKKFNPELYSNGQFDEFSYIQWEDTFGPVTSVEFDI